MKMIALLLSLLLFAEGFAQNCNEPNSLVSVRKRKVGTTEYVIFTIKKPVTATSDIAVAKPPFTHVASGNTIHVKGCRFTKVRFDQAVWTCTIKEIWGSTSLIKQVKNIGQFEGDIQYVIGYKCSAKHVVNYEYDDGDYKKIIVRVKY